MIVRLLSVFLGLLSFMGSSNLYAQNTASNKLGMTDTINYLNQVVVTATRTPKALKDVPVVTRVITQAEIKKEAPRSLADLLETELPGLEFTRTEGVSNSITFNGLGANYLLILIDGERIAGETQRSNPDFNRIDIDNVERIEIVKGAMSTLYGSGAVAGIINIITKKTQKPFQAGFEALYSGEGEEKIGASTGFKKGKFSSYTSAMANFKQRYFFKDTEIEGFRNMSFTEKLHYTLPDRLSLGLRGTFYTHQRYNAGLVGELMNDLYRDWNFLFTGEYFLSGRSKLYFSYNFDNYGKYNKYLKINEKKENYRDVINNPKLIFSTEVLKNNTFVVGAEVFNETLKTYQFKDGDKGATQFAAFLQDDYQFSDRFSVQAGVRMDYHSSYKRVSVIPKVSAMYKLGEKKEWNIRAAYSGGYRTPTLKELYTTWEHQGMFVLVGNDKLKAERSNNFQGGVEFTKRKVNISVNAFYNHIYDKINTIWNVGQDTSYYANIEEAKILGADANVRIQLFKKFAVKMGYAYVNDNQKIAGLNMSSTRPHSAIVRFEYNFDAFEIPFTLGLNGRWLSKINLWSEKTENEYEMTHYPAYQIWKLNLVGKTDFGLRFNLGVNNIFNYKPKIVTYNAGITRGITILAGVSIAFEEMFKK